MSFPLKMAPEDLAINMVRAQLDDNKWRSRKELCALVGRAKSPHIILLIEALVDMNWLEKRKVGTYRQINTYEYRAPVESWAGWGFYGSAGDEEHWPGD